MVGDFGTTSDFQTQKKPPTLATFDYASDFQIHAGSATFVFIFTDTHDHIIL